MITDYFPFTINLSEQERKISAGCILLFLYSPLADLKPERELLLRSLFFMFALNPIIGALYDGHNQLIIVTSPLNVWLLFFMLMI
jgi:hypothetical protein